MIGDENIAYMIEATKPISDVTALAIMSGNILSLSATGCSSLDMRRGESGGRNPDFDIDLDYDSVNVWITNDIIREKDVKFTSDHGFKKWLGDNLFCYGWKIYTINEDAPQIEFVKRFDLELSNFDFGHPF